MFGEGPTEGEEDGEEEGDIGEDRDNTGEDTGYIWLSLVDCISNLTREPFSKVWEMGIIEFFNLLGYSHYKAEKEKERIERWKQKNRL